ncbi:class I SAM-dependent methyltransferase [Mycobacterium koreense]|uniref:SAM-dependent methyltransferase n=1 Tax=Mycolicibacillus koreensis TaxID=1069220 RepID=A0A7I7SEH2_9MYCO|nr:cyclopropane mycolic acid synthase family methyltransferase [Mycolicibacillus koreensis]MCV7248372.1 class I SAM-dependent methyltransferase [Mycolicibacillus koreensis]OSC34319.1 SAM-dependent methyltransferase [Mycolicibacillus koreensis]BBY55312.1 hydroxymycolate synthase MmaA4 [Mycolicibacillus koreensis]
MYTPPTSSSEAPRLRPRFDDVQAHYDLSDDFFALFQDPSRTYSCAYFEPPELTLEQAQVAKVDLNLDKLDLQPGMTLLDIGCGWGATMRRAIEKYDVNVIGLTLSKNQRAYSQRLLNSVGGNRDRLVLLQGWEQFRTPVDRIVSIEAFEHFGHERYDDFFARCFDILPDDGRMTIQSSASYHPYELNARGKKLTFETARFIKFIVTEIFPKGRLPSTQMMIDHGEKAGFAVEEALSLRPHYIKTLHLWSEALKANRDRAIEVTSEEVYQRYMRYLTGCEYYFRDEVLDVSLVSYHKSAATSATD